MVSRTARRTADNTFLPYLYVGVAWRNAETYINIAYKTRSCFRRVPGRVVGSLVLDKSRIIAMSFTPEEQATTFIGLFVLTKLSCTCCISDEIGVCSGFLLRKEVRRKEQSAESAIKAGLVSFFFEGKFSVNHDEEAGRFIQVSRANYSLVKS